MIHSRTRLSLTVVVLGFALVAACTTNVSVPTFTPARPASTLVPTIVSPVPTGPDGAVATVAPPADIQGLELVGYLGSDQAQAVFVQGDYAYVGFGIELAVVDISDPGRPQRVGYVVLPNWVLDIAVTGSHAYVATGGDGLHLVDLSDPTRPTVLGTYYASSHVNSVVVDDSYAYVSSDGLRVLDLADPAGPAEVGAWRSLDLRPVGKVVAVVGNYAYTIYHGGSSKTGDLRIVDVSDPSAPVEVGAFVMTSPVHGAAVSGDHAFLLVGQGIPRLAVVNVSDPRHPVEVGLDPVAPWLGESLAVADRYVYLARRDSSGLTGHLQVLDVADPAHPIALGRYEGMTPPLAEVEIVDKRAYVAMGDGLAVVNVFDPTAPVGIGLYQPDAMPGTGRDVTLAGHPLSQAYVYVAAGEGGLLVVDVSDPVNPQVVSRHDTAGQTWDVVVAGGYAYLADEYNGLRVIDVADAFNPVEVGSYDIPGLDEFFHGVAVAGSSLSEFVYAYIADGGLLNTGLRIVDISDPAHPAEVGFLPIKIQTASDFLPARIEDVAVANGYVYLAAGTAGLRVVDVSDPTAPVEVGFYDTPGRADNLVVVGRHAYLADGDLRIVDVSDPTAPALVGFYDLPGSAATPYVAVQGRYAYVTDQGTLVLNVSDPGAPVQVAAHPMALGNVAVSGEKVYVVGNGLFILRSLAVQDADPKTTPQAPPPLGNGECETYTAAMTLSATPSTLKVGEVLSVTVALANQGCGSLGMPQYRLYVQSDDVQPVLDPGRPEPVVHYLGIGPGQTDTAEFALRAIGSGLVTLSASASFEFHVGYPGPAYWGGSSAGPLEIIVAP